jgi:hypothetical protein
MAYYEVGQYKEPDQVISFFTVSNERANLFRISSAAKKPTKMLILE